MLCDGLEGGGTGGRRGGDICVIMIDSRCCEETNTFKVTIFQLKKLKLKKSSSQGLHLKLAEILYQCALIS